MALRRSVVLPSAALATVLVVACSSFDSSDADGSQPPPAGTDGGDEASYVGGEAASPFVLSLQAGPRVELIRGKRTDVVVQVERRVGFSGEAVISVRDLPQGVVAEPLTILAGEKLGTLGLTATSAVSHGLAAPVLRASDRESKQPPGELKFDLVLRGDPGSLDESFGKKGVADLPLANTSLVALASQTDGKLVYLGAGGGSPNVVVGRLEANGATDATFGMQGYLRFAFGAGVDQAAAVLVQPDGRVVVVGTAVSENQVGVLRLTAAGTLDTTFAGTGKALVGTGVGAAISARLADDGSVFVLSGSISSPLAVGKLLPSGSLDSTFGVGGWVTIPTSSYATSIGLLGSDIALSPKSVVVSCIVRRAQGADVRVGLATIARSGQGTPVFGETTVASVSQYEVPLVMRNDGLAVVGLNSYASGPEAMLLYAFTADGKTMDSNFGGGNPVVSPADDVPFAMVEDASHRLLVAGQVYSAPFKVRLLRYLPQGAPDLTFGVSGVNATLVGDESLAKALVVQQDGRIVVGADRTTAAVPAMALLRYWP